MGYGVGVGDCCFGDEVVVFGVGQFFQVVGLFELVELYEVVGVVGQFVFQVGVQEFVGFGIVVYYLFYVVWVFVFEYQFGVVQFEFVVFVVFGIVVVEVGQIVVELVVVGLDQVFEGDF